MSDISSADEELILKGSSFLSPKAASVLFAYRSVHATICSINLYRCCVWLFCEDRGLFTRYLALFGFSFVLRLSHLYLPAVKTGVVFFFSSVILALLFIRFFSPTRRWKLRHTDNLSAFLDSNITPSGAWIRMLWNSVSHCIGQLPDFKLPWMLPLDSYGQNRWIQTDTRRSVLFANYSKRIWI